MAVLADKLERLSFWKDFFSNAMPLRKMTFCFSVFQHCVIHHNTIQNDNTKHKNKKDTQHKLQTAQQHQAFRVTILNIMMLSVL